MAWEVREPRCGALGVQRRTGVDRGELDPVSVGGHQAGGVDDENVVGAAAVGSGIEELVQSLRMQSKDPLVERRQPLLRGRVGQDLVQDVRP
jgi:hypothetical protein